MTGQQLKNSILQWAIEGKLVPQIESEGTAEDLLKEIRADRSKKIKLGEIKLSKPEKGIKAKEIHELDIPKTWTWCLLSDVCRVFGRIGFRGYTKDDLVKEKEGAISLSPSNMKENGLIFDNCTYISWNKYEESPEIKVQEGDILIVKTGSSYGKTSLVDNLPWKSTINPQIAVIKDITINKLFLKYLLDSPYCKKMYELFVLGTSIPTFSQLNLLSLDLPLPPLSEQKRIVSKIEELMPLVEEYGKAQERLEALNKELPEKLKKSVLQEAIMGKLVPQDPKEGTAEELVKSIKKIQIQLINEKKIKVGKYNKEINKIDLPQGWCCVKLGDISSLITKQTGFDYSNTIKPNLIEVKKENTIPMIQTKNFKGKSFDLDTDYYIPLSVAEKFPNIMLNEKCMLLSIVGASVGNVGVYNEGKLGIIGGAICKVVLLDERLYDYIYYFLRSPQGHNEIRKNFKSTAQGTITVQDVREIQIPLPPLEEQKRIVAKLEEVMGKIEGMKI